MSGGEQIAVANMPADPSCEPPEVKSAADSSRGTTPPTPTPRAGSAAHDQAVVSGVLWQGSLRWLAQVLSWSATIIIARKLSPEDYGIASSATILVTLLTVVTDGGIGRSLVVRRERDDVVMRQAHGASIALGFALAPIMLLAAYPLSRFYGEPRVAPMIAVLSLVLVFSGLNAIPIALMQQRLEYRRLAAVDLAKAIAQAMVVIAGALLGFGAWALVTGLLAGQLTAVLLARRLSKLQPLWPTWRHLKPTIMYARYLVAGTLAWSVYSISDFAAVGRVVGVAALGYYQFSWNVAQLPGEKLGSVLQSVVGPFFGTIGDDHTSLRHYFLLLSEMLMSVMLPVLTGFALVAHIAVPLLFGDKWLPAIPVMQILVLSAAVSSLSILTQHVLVASGYAAASTRVTVVAAIVLPVVFYLAARFSGTLAVAGVWLLTQPVLTLVSLSNVRRAVQLPIRSYLMNLRAPVVCSALMAGVVVAAGRMFPSMPPIAKLSALCAAGAIAYMLAYLLLYRDRLSAYVLVWKARV
jgi:O-antigen/teichoic acid export membrane protein